MGKLILFITFFLFSFSPYQLLQKIQINGSAQGTTYHITYYAEDSLVTKQQIDSILDRIDSSLSLYKPYSLINRFNQSADGLIPDKHLANVVRKALTVYQATDGFFDITVYPLTAAWGFGPSKTDSMPGNEIIQQILPCVDSRLLYWQGTKLVKKKPCVQLDPNGIAQGYSVDVLADFLEAKGIRQYLVELGGEIRVKGRKMPGNEKMSIGIEAPGDETAPALMEKIIWLEKGAVTTSGNYRRYHESQGRRISHLLDPHTGYPLQNELISVTVFASDAITADAYDNALMAMGLEKALRFVEQREELAAYFIYRKADGAIGDTASRQFARFLQP